VVEIEGYPRRQDIILKTHKQAVETHKYVVEIKEMLAVFFRTG
jgi:hypothetical protein